MRYAFSPRYADTPPCRCLYRVDAAAIDAHYLCSFFDAFIVTLIIYLHYAMLAAPLLLCHMIYAFR